MLIPLAQQLLNEVDDQLRLRNSEVFIRAHSNYFCYACDYGTLQEQWFKLLPAYNSLYKLWEDKKKVAKEIGIDVMYNVWGASHRYIKIEEQIIDIKKQILHLQNILKPAKPCPKCREHYNLTSVRFIRA